MQLRTYSKKNSLTAVDVIDALKSHNAAIDWVVTSALDPSDIEYLNLTFGLSQPALPAPKEQFQLSASDLNFPDNGKDNTQLQTSVPTGDLAEFLQAHSTNLSDADIETLQTAVQTSIVEESAEFAAYKDFQRYKAIYAHTTRTLRVDHVYEKLDSRNLARKEFEDEQNELVAQKPIPEQADDLTTQMLGILKTGKYKSIFLTSKFEQI